MKHLNEIQISNALAIADFNQFFSLIPQVNSSYERYNLTLQALEIAKQQNNINILKQLVEIEFDHWDFKRLFEQLLKALVELNATETAFGIIIRHGDKKLEVGESWYLLAKELLIKNNLTEIKQILHYIKATYQQVEIIKSCLEKITLPEQVLTWLEWFELYTQTQTETYTSLNFTPIIAALAAYQDFTSACNQLQKIKSSSSKQQVLRQLYLHLLTSQKLEKLTRLNLILPDEINWLIKIPQIFEDESQFNILAKLEYQEVTPIINLAIKSLLARQQINNDVELAKIIINAAKLSEKYQQEIIETASDLFLENSRIDAVINLLPFLNNYTKTNKILALLEHNLFISQYQAIVQQLDKLETSCHYYSYTSDEEKIISKIPSWLIAEEHKRRAQNLITESQEKFAKTNNIHSKHPDYYDITNTIDKLLEHKQYDIAFNLCLKLVASKARDHYLLKFFYFVIGLSNFNSANKIANLFSQKEIKQALTQFLQCYQIFNYRKSLKVLLKLNNKIPLPNLMLDCVNNILAENNSFSAIQFLIDNGIFDLSEGFSDEDNSKVIKRRVVRLIVDQYKNDKAIIKLMKNLPRRNINQFELYLFDELLAANRLITVIKLLNACLDEANYGQKQLTSDLEELNEKITEYIDQLEPNVESLAALALLKDEFLKTTLISNLLKDIIEEPSSINLQIIITIPEIKLRISYLIKLMINCIEKNYLPLVKQALLYLPKDDQSIWSKIITSIEQHDYVEILNILLNETSVEIDLLDWTIERWFVNKSPSYLLKNLLNFCKWLCELDAQKQPDFLSNDYIKNISKRKIYQTLISQTFHQWQQLLIKTKDYSEFLVGITSLLPQSENLKSSIDLFSSLRTVVNSMLTEQYYDEAFTGLQLLTQLNKYYFYYFFAEIFAIVLKNNSLEFIDKLLTLIEGEQSYWLETALIKLGEIYLAKTNYSKVISLLKNHSTSHTMQQKIKDWVIDLIKTDKIDNASEFINTLLPSANETIFIEITEQLIAKKQLFSTLRYLNEKITTPGVKLRLQKELRTIYFNKLETWLGKDITDHLQLAQQKLAKFKLFIKHPDKRVQANQLKNEIIVDLRSQLDKAFLAFYRRKYGEPSLTNGNYLNVFFPRIPNLKNKTVNQRLNDYFTNKLKQPDFATQNPNLFKYLEYIQPLHNLAYNWFDQLYEMANTQKHDKDLPLEPEVKGIKIDMQLYLPKLIDGVTELLLKLNYPDANITIIQALQFSRFVPLITSETAPDLENFGIFPAAANAQNINNNQNIMPKRYQI